MLIEKIYKTIETHQLIEIKDHIVIGLSGGPDSVCLFHVLMQLSDRLKLTIHPVHVNHRFRPGAAEADQAYVEALCAQYGLACHSFTVNCSELAADLGLTSEEAGRKARYDAFCQVAEEVEQTFAASADTDPKESRRLPGDGAGTCTTAGQRKTGRVKIAVAQNANDQAETVLFRLLRGTGTDGLAGIAYKRQERGFPVIRPLLDIYRAEIEAYCEANGLQPVRDHTNEEAIYVRNKIRLKLLPHLKDEYNENILQSLVRLSRIAAADKDYLWQEAEEVYRRLTGTAMNPGEILMDRAALHDLHPTIRHRVVLKAFGEIGLHQDVTEERLKSADAIIEKKQAPKTVQFPHGYRLTVAKGQVRFFHENLVK